MFKGTVQNKWDLQTKNKLEEYICKGFDHKGNKFQLYSCEGFQNQSSVCL